MSTADRAQDLISWLRLDRTPGVGPGTARRLLAQFGLPADVFRADHPALAGVAGEAVARALLAPPSRDTQVLTENTLAWAQQPGNCVLTLGDCDYPRALLEIADPPLILYATGCIELLNARSLAVVGSRNATTQGMLNAESFSETLSKAGLTIVSGLALGIDTAAHRGGLRGAGSTVAVIGTGPDIVYPARNRALAHEIAASGCILSEYPLGTPSIASNFPRRNRIISGLSRGVLVVEAAAQSGSLITARMAAEQGRDVFAIPGSIHSPLSKGGHLLIKQGAKLVESAQDVLEELDGFIAPSVPASTGAPSPTSCPNERQVLAALGFDPVPLDELATRCAMDIGELQGRLLTMELNGVIEVLPGGMVRQLATG